MQLSNILWIWDNRNSGGLIYIQGRYIGYFLLFFLLPALANNFFRLADKCQKQDFYFDHVVNLAPFSQTEQSNNNCKLRFIHLSHNWKANYLLFSTYYSKNAFISFKQVFECLINNWITESKSFYLKFKKKCLLINLQNIYF